jgi:hypothetical protein
VEELRGSDGAVLATIYLGGNPTGQVFDGTDIWVALGSANSVAKIRASDGAMLGFFHTGAYPQDLAFDGANVWSGNTNDDTVSKL